MAKRVAILQSNYIPWKGYFDIINYVDEFIIFDDVQYTRRDWRNRNKIKTSSGGQWLTIPVIVKNKFSQKIKETMVSDNHWRQKHWESLRHNYSKAPFFDLYQDAIKSLYLDSQETMLTAINSAFIRAVCAILSIDTKLTYSMDYYPLADEKSERILKLCKDAGATEYLAGPSSKCYLDCDAFASAGIRVTWMDYSGYPEYRQFFPPFDHNVSILDLIFQEGPQASAYMLTFGGK